MSAADESAVHAADRAENAAQDAESAADSAMAAAARAAVAAALVPYAADVQALKDEIARLTGDEVADDAETSDLRKLVTTTQTQMLWITSGSFLLGAGAAYVMLKAFE